MLKLTLSSEQAEELFLTGKSLYENRELNEAILYFQRAIELNYNSFWSHHLLGCSFEKLGKQDEAIAAWQQAIHVDDCEADKSWTYYHLALAQEQQGNLKKAIDYCQRAVQIKSERSDFIELLSRLDRSSRQKQMKTSSITPTPSDLSNQSNHQILYLPASDRSSSNEISITLATPTSGPESFLPATLPIPPKPLMEYGESSEHHLQTGERTVATMLDIVQKADRNIANCQRILEFGCANGRLLRWLANFANKSEIWGVDIQSDKIFWAIENLNPPFNFAVNTTVPHLPFRDGYFDFIFAGSIFTHINELHVGWLLELSRLLSPEGLLYVTFHDEHTLEYLKSNSHINLAKKLNAHPLSQQIYANEFDLVSILPYSKGMLSQVFMKSQYIQQITKSFLQLVSINPNAYSDLQTAY